MSRKNRVCDGQCRLEAILAKMDVMLREVKEKTSGDEYLRRLRGERELIEAVRGKPLEPGELVTISDEELDE